ncbi:class I SAM-dependent methyltransferase [Gordonia liuliyuniae]|uniref:Class I SAM-dependent methyltransferase n=1 Tax=Gordonia liuliyuniae TaxID=2911517 RepID=A0ABS9IQD7_9ACTN|nr:class I SAM-dependent methyltransferase [Gordonia liuliyuniae]MCF8587775.1 class I SAM-dependent methyltransferase [Gordonia liuliyuniae]
MTGARGRWNHNIHYHRVVLDAVPDDARSALDVGTGNGLLAADLRTRIGDVTAIDVDEHVLGSARDEIDGVRWICGDVMDYELDTFDVVASVATFHHLPDPRAALRRLADLTAPGGVLAILGLARPSNPVDYAYAVAGVFQHRWLSWRNGYWEHSAPTVWPPPQTYTQVRGDVLDELPGATWQRLPMFRYSVLWRRPYGPPGRA